MIGLKLTFLSIFINADSFSVKILVAFGLTTMLYFVFKYGLRRLKFKQKDLKAAGLNNGQRRQWLAERRKRKKTSKFHF